MPWELEGDLGPLENEEDQELPIEEVIERMYNIREQVLDVAAANIKRAQKIQARSCNAKHCRNAFEVGEKVWRKNPLWNTKQKLLNGPYEIAERDDGGKWKLPVDGSFRQKQGPSVQEILPSKPSQEVHPQKPRDS